MSTPDHKIDYFADSADLEGSLDLPVLGLLESETRFYQRHDDILGLAPDPRLAERLDNFIQFEQPVIWVVGLGNGGVELPVAVGLAERSAARGAVPTLLVGPELELPARLGAEGLRRVEPGRFAMALQTLFPQGCGAQATGIMGVQQVWPGSDPEAPPVHPEALILASHWAAEELRLPADGISATILVVPYRDEPARELSERVTLLRSLGYPLMGMVAMSAAGAEQAAGWGGAAPVAPDDQNAAPAAVEGGFMEAETNGRERVEEEVESTAEAEVPSEEDAPAAPADMPPTEEGFAINDTDYDTPEAEATAGEDAAREASRPWSDAYGPGTARLAKARRKRARLPWWGVALLLVVLAGASYYASQWLRSPGGEEASIDLPPLSTAEVQPEALGPPQDSPAAEPTQDSPVAEPTPDGRAAEPPAQESAAPAASPESPDPGEPAAEPTAAADEPAMEGAPPMASEGFGVLCGSFRDISLAAQEVTRLQAQGLAARVVMVELPGRGTWNRVVVGQWRGIDQARQAAQRAVDAGWIGSAMIIAADGYGLPIGPVLE